MRTKSRVAGSIALVACAVHCQGCGVDTQPAPAGAAAARGPTSVVSIDPPAGSTRGDSVLVDDGDGAFLPATQFEFDPGDPLSIFLLFL